jgi:hypothetical protein
MKIYGHDVEGEVALAIPFHQCNNMLAQFSLNMEQVTNYKRTSEHHKVQAANQKQKQAY